MTGEQERAAILAWLRRLIDASSADERGMAARVGCSQEWVRATICAQMATVEAIKAGDHMKEVN